MGYIKVENTDTPHSEPTYLELIWQQFRKRRLAYAALWGSVSLFLVAIYAPLLASNKPFLWRVDRGRWSSPWLASLLDRNFFESALDIFFNCLLLPGTPIVIGAWLLWRRARRIVQKRARVVYRRRVLMSGCAVWAVMFLGLLLMSTSQPKVVYPTLQQELVATGHHVDAIYPLWPYSYRDIDLQSVRLGSSAVHPLGTDNAGRDVLVRLLFGTRISLTIGIFAVFLYITLGTALGALAGYYGGRIDAMIMRAIEVVISIPSLFLILTAAAFIEKRSIFHIMAIIAAVSWTTPARLTRAEFLRLRNLDFVMAARASGFPEWMIIFKHILPNALGPVLVTATFGVASSILVESTMSFLGLGDITVPSWGQILNTGRTTGMWTLILAPGLAIFLTVSFLNVLGEGLQDALDPKLRR